MNDSKDRQTTDMRQFKDELENVMERVEEINEKMYDFEANKRNNLIFYGIPNEIKETQPVLLQKIKYFNTKAKERENSVREIMDAKAEDLEQRKEIARLRKQDRDEFMNRRQHYEQLEKQKIWQSIQEKHARADNIK